MPSATRGEYSQRLAVTAVAPLPTIHSTETLGGTLLSLSFYARTHTLGGDDLIERHVFPFTAPEKIRRNTHLFSLALPPTKSELFTKQTVI